MLSIAYIERVRVEVQERPQHTYFHADFKSMRRSTKAVALATDLKDGGFVSYTFPAPAFYGEARIYHASNYSLSHLPVRSKTPSALS